MNLSLYTNIYDEFTTICHYAEMTDIIRKTVLNSAHPEDISKGEYRRMIYQLTLDMHFPNNGLMEIITIENEDGSKEEEDVVFAAFSPEPNFGSDNYIFALVMKREIFILISENDLRDELEYTSTAQIRIGSLTIPRSKIRYAGLNQLSRQTKFNLCQGLCANSFNILANECLRLIETLPMKEFNRFRGLKLNKSKGFEMLWSILLAKRRFVDQMHPINENQAYEFGQGFHFPPEGFFDIPEFFPYELSTIQSPLFALKKR